jgi:uncharacterized protein (DUF2336 family)
MKLIAIERVMRGLASARIGRTALQSSRFADAQNSDQPEIGDAPRPNSLALRDEELVEAKDVARHAAEQAMKMVATQRGMLEAIEVPEGNNVFRFLDWAQTATPEERAKAASALARAYRCIDLPDHLRRDALAGLVPKLDKLRRDAEVCLTAIVDDKFPQVRRALAEALADAHDAPRHIISALANDQPEIAAVILARSPLLDDAELVEYATVGGLSVQVALARRPDLSEYVATFLVETDRREVALALVENAAAHFDHGPLRRIGERFGEDGEVRDALLRRPELPPALRYDLFAVAATAFPRFAIAEIGEKRVERMVRDTLEQCAILVASSSKPDEVRDLVRRLRATGVLTPALLVRAVISGSRGLFEAAGAELTGVSPERIAGFVREPFGPGFAALYRRMGLPPQFLMPFRTALAALAEFASEDTTRISCPIVSRMIAVCENAGTAGPSDLLSLLRRLEAQAVLGETRALAERAAERRAATLLRGESGSAASVAVIEPALLRMLSLLHRFEADAALAELEVAPAAFSQHWDAIDDASLAA